MKKPLNQVLFGWLRKDLLMMFSGDPEGGAPWVAQMGDGHDAGYFGPDSAVWHVNGAAPTLVAGIRALMMQTLHPGAMAGVADHSRYHSDPLGRLAGTVRWVVVTTFGSTDTVATEVARVEKMHRRVTGEYQPNSDTGSAASPTPYAASDKSLIAWVHLVFTDAFLGSHVSLGRDIPDKDGESGPDRYVREWATAGILMGYNTPPTTQQGLKEAIEAFLPELRSDERVADALKFILDPPLPPSIRPGYRLLSAAAVASLEPQYRTLLGLKRPWWPALTIGRVAVAFIGWVLGAESPSMTKARERINALPEDKRHPVTIAPRGGSAHGSTSAQP
ncbi:DUF2236-like protein [Pontimonas salivibrio]|uniref:DUF2236-like protein n=2 Tax=Pontimonas salivibrio TaxID=1159327 RepID=A0A2L2BRP8_9MICO|nr:DUF2236-like protein [Pontimonas salivibrio]